MPLTADTPDAAVFIGRFQPFQTLGEDVRADARQRSADLAEAARSEHELAHHEERPAFTDELESVGGAACVVVPARFQRPLPFH